MTKEQNNTSTPTDEKSVSSECNGGGANKCPLSAIAKKRGTGKLTPITVEGETIYIKRLTARDMVRVKMDKNLPEFAVNVRLALVSICDADGVPLYTVEQENEIGDLLDNELLAEIIELALGGESVPKQ